MRAVTVGHLAVCFATYVGQNSSHKFVGALDDEDKLVDLESLDDEPLLQVSRTNISAEATSSGMLQCNARDSRRNVSTGLGMSAIMKKKNVEQEKSQHPRTTEFLVVLPKEESRSTSYTLQSLKLEYPAGSASATKNVSMTRVASLLPELGNLYDLDLGFGAMLNGGLFTDNLRMLAYHGVAPVAEGTQEIICCAGCCADTLKVYPKSGPKIKKIDLEVRNFTFEQAELSDDVGLLQTSASVIVSHKSPSLSPGLPPVLPELRRSAQISNVKPNTAKMKKDSPTPMLRRRRSIKSQEAAYCCFAIAYVCYSVLVFNQCTVSTEDSGHDDHRSFLLDNGKAFAMFLVIFTHSLGQMEINGYADRDSLQFHDSISELITTFSMPMFSLISGLCSQRPPTAKRIRDLITGIALPAIIHVVLVKPILIDTSDTSESDNISAVVRLRTLPNMWHLKTWPWYLVALLAWRICSFILHAVHLHSCTPAIGVFISCVGGYICHSHLHYIESTIGFGAFFALGCMLPLDVIEKRGWALSSITRLAAAAGVLLWSMGSLAFTAFLPFPDQHFCFAHMDVSLNHPTLWLWRLAKMSLDSVACLLLLLFVIPCRETCLTQAGRYTLYAYLHHRIGLNLFAHMLREKLEVVNIPLSPAKCMLVYFMHAASAMASMLFFTSWPWRMLLSWAVEPTWASPIVKLLIPDSTTMELKHTRL